MPPKKAAKKGKKKKVPKLLIDDVDVSQMGRDELEQFAWRLKDKLEVARQERSKTQLERDKIRVLWDNDRNQLEEIEFQLHELDLERERSSELAEENMKMIEQAMKHIEYKTMTAMAIDDAETAERITEAQEAFEEDEEQLRLDIRELRSMLREQQDFNETELEEIRAKQHRELSLLSHMKSAEAARLEHAEQINNVKKDMQLICRMEIFETEERKNAYMELLTHSNDDAYNTLAEYYNDILGNNIALIVAMKENLAMMKKNIANNKRHLKEMTNNCNELKKPAADAAKELRKLSRMKNGFERERTQREHFTERNKQVNAEIQSLSSQVESMLERNYAILKVIEETEKFNNDFRKELQQMLPSAGIKQKAKQLKNEKKLRVEFNCPACHELDAALDAKNKQIEESKFQAMRCAKAHDDLLDTLSALFKGLGLPSGQFDIERLAVKDNLPIIKGPVGPIDKVSL